MNLLNSTNAKIKIIYLILISTLIIIIRLETLSTEVQFLHVDASNIHISYQLSLLLFSNKILPNINNISLKRFYRKGSNRYSAIGESLWNDYKIDLSKESILKDSLIRESINSFFDKYLTEQKLINQHVIVLFRVKTVDGIIYTIGKLISLSFFSLF